MRNADNLKNFGSSTSDVYVLEEEMEIDLSKAETAKEWIEFMIVRLLLKFSSSNDNFTVVGGIVK